MGRVPATPGILHRSGSARGPHVDLQAGDGPAVRRAETAGPTAGLNEQRPPATMRAGSASLIMR